VTQLPPGSYSMTKLANYRLQKGGLRNTKNVPINGAAPGQIIGGTVGEMIMQYLTEPLTANVKPVSVMFNAAADAVSTYYPPFTWNYHEAEWLAPYDAQIALGAIHSHHRMVKGLMNPAGGFPPRVNSPNPLCGGLMNPTSDSVNAYTDWYWEDAPVCEWWKDADGTIPLRKGQAWRTTCYINNGVTPEAIKHGLVAGASAEALRQLGAPIPDYPNLVPASTWGGVLADSPVGKELLYGTHPPINYRVKYSCGSDPVTTTTQPLSEGVNCNPNPAVDEHGEYVDGSYKNDVQCGSTGGYCNPSAIVFACVGEEEMCIGVTMYYAMPRPLNSDGSPNEGFIAEAQAGHVNNLGTPVNTGLPTDVLVGGNCPDCKAGL
jgi:hypothetical protein